MILILSKYLIPNGFRSVTLFPFVLIKCKDDKKNTVLLNHEKIHLQQQIELLILPFFIWYALEFLINLIRFKNSNQAYLNISFEREAYFNENNLSYLSNRSLWAFRNFLTK
jgi:hypothetical protein